MIERPPPRPFQVVLRLVVFSSAFAAAGLTRLAGDEPLLVFDVAILALGVWCALAPDSHLGLVVVGLIGVHWLVAVDDAITPWSLGIAVSVALFHASMSSASVSPAAARWTAAMQRRWGRRTAVGIGAAVPTWAVVRVVGEVEIDGTAIVLATALAAIAVGGLWVGHGVLHGRRRADT